MINRVKGSLEDLITVRICTPVGLNITSVRRFRVALNDGNSKTIQFKTLHFTSLHFTQRLHFSPGPQSAVCSPHTALLQSMDKYSL